MDSSFLGKGPGAAITQKIAAHPTTVALVIGLLVLLLVVLVYLVHKYRAQHKAGFGVTRYNNLETGNNNPIWQLGSGDAGWGGSLHRETTPVQMAETHPGWRAGASVPGYREGMAGGRAACPPGRTVVTYQDPDGSATTRCVSAGVGPSVAVCGSGWDPAASAEAEALATVGALSHSPSGERRLMSAADAAFDSRLGISDEALMQAMHNGGTP